MSTYFWLIVAGILLICEMFTATIYLLMLSVAALLAWLAQVMGANLLSQAVVFCIGAVCLTLLARHIKSRSAQPDEAMDLDAGHRIQVLVDDSGAHTQYRGANWPVQHIHHETLQPGEYTIVRLSGTEVIVQ